MRSYNFVESDGGRNLCIFTHREMSGGAQVFGPCRHPVSLYFGSLQSLDTGS
jgi:hypothetical protein